MFNIDDMDDALPKDNVDHYPVTEDEVYKDESPLMRIMNDRAMEILRNKQSPQEIKP